MESGDSHGPSAWGLEVCWDGGGRGGGAVLPGLRVVELDAVAATVTASAVAATVPRN